MSLRDLLFFVAGVALTGAFSAYFFTSNAHHGLGTNTVLVSQADMPHAIAVTPDFDAKDVRTAEILSQSQTSAGSLDEVTSKLAARLAAKGGSEADWRLLAESYDYMGKSQEAVDARAHIAVAAATVPVASAH
jgi:predicted Zn-dependent protease